MFRIVRLVFIFLIFLFCVNIYAFAQEENSISEQQGEEIQEEQKVTIPSITAPQVYVPQQKEIVFNQSTFKIDVIDPKANTNVRGLNYPGLRGANQLVLYSPAFGFRTNTNEFGTEAIVTGDTVTSLSGADSLIPANGFVISGHGRAKKWINENIMVGARIAVDIENNTITSYITSDTFLYSAREKIKEVQNMKFFYAGQSSLYNPRKSEQYIEKANEFIERAERDGENAQRYASRAIEYADMAMAAAIPYESEELKGVWIRPDYHTIEDIISTLDRIADAGINNIFIETYYHGQTIYPSAVMEKYGFIKQNPNYISFDPMRVWVTEAHRRGIKVHIWFESFYVGNKPPESCSEYILAKHPDWANYQKKNAESDIIPYSVSEHNGYFIDPANPNVQTFLCELITEIISKYHPDGINLDYIRYPQSLAPNYSTYDLSNWGYTRYARQEFQNIYGIDPIELTVSSPLWFQWKMYRAGKVTDFVRKVGQICRANDVTFTAVIFPNREMAMDTKLQDWRTWSMNGYVDGFTPLFLTCDDKTAMNLMANVLRNKSASTKLYGGLFVTFMNGSNADLLKQIHAARRYCLSGLIIFDYAHLNDNYIQTLTQSVFKPLDKVSGRGRRGRR